MLGARVRDLTGTPVFCGSRACDLCLIWFFNYENDVYPKKAKKGLLMNLFLLVTTSIQVVVAILRYSFLRSCFGIFINWIFYVKQTYQKAV